MSDAQTPQTAPTALDRLLALVDVVFRWLVDLEGSTRIVGLLRIGLVALLWARFGREMLLYRHTDPVWLIISLNFFACTPLLMAGLFTRVVKFWSAATMASLIFVLGQWRGHEPYLHHHVHLLVAAVVLLALTPCERSYSVDRYLALRKGKALPECGPLWGQRLIALQVSAVYFFGAIDKLNGAFLSGARMSHYLLEFYTESDLPDFPGYDALMAVMAIGVTLLEFALAIGLFVRRVRWPLILAGFFLHLAFYVALPVSTFSATICLLYLAFLDPDATHRVIDALQAPVPTEPIVDDESPAVDDDSASAEPAVDA